MRKYRLVLQWLMVLILGINVQVCDQTFWRASCGFAYHIVPEFQGQNEVMFLSPSGNVFSYCIESNSLKPTTNYYGEISNPGEAELTLIVDGAAAYLFANEKLIAKNVSTMADYQDNFSWERDWGFAVVSGSDENFWYSLRLQKHRFLGG